MWNGIPQPQMPPQQYPPGGMAPPIPGVQNRPRLEPIDWNLVAVLNADIIRRTKDYDSLQKLVQIFMAAKLYPGSSRILVHPLCLRLCQLLQVAFEYLNFCQTELSAMNTKLEAENAKLTEKSAKLTSKLKKAEQTIKSKSQPYDRCPVCEKKFKNLDFIDRHITNRHTELVEAWSIIRGRKPPMSKENEDNVQRILDKIDHLKNSLRRGSNKNNSIEQELIATQQELMDAEEFREQQEMKQNEEIRRQLFEAADDLNSSMNVYKEQVQKKKALKKTKPRMAIANLFDPNANINPTDYQNFPNSEPSPFNSNNKEDEATKQKRINNFFSQPPNPFQKPQLRPSNNIDQGPNWNDQANNKNKIVNPFQNKSNLTQYSIPHQDTTNNININDNIYNNNNFYDNENAYNAENISNNFNLNHNINNFDNKDQFGFDTFNDHLDLGGAEPMMNTGFKNNFIIDNINHENVQVIPQPKLDDEEKGNIPLIKPIPKQAILAAKKFISKQDDEKNNKKEDSRNIKATPESIEKVISMIGNRVSAEIQRLGPDGVAPLIVKQKYGDNDPNYLRLRRQIQQKLEMEYPMDGNVTKVKKGFDLIHTEDLTSINNESQNRVNNNNREYETENGQLYSSPSKEKPIMNINYLNDMLDSQFTSAFEFNNNNNQKQPEEKATNVKDSPEKKKVETSEVASVKNANSVAGSNNNNNKNVKPDEVEWSYVSSSTSEKASTKQEKNDDDNKNDNVRNSPSIVKENNLHSISFDSSSTSSKLKSKAKNNNDFDFIQSDMKPNFSDSPSRKTETQSPQPTRNQNNSNSIANDINNTIENEKNSSVHTPERKEGKKLADASLEIFNSPVLTNVSNSNLSSKSKSSGSNRKIKLDDDEDSVENLSNIDKMFKKSKDLSEFSETEVKQEIKLSPSKIEPLSEDEFNFPPVATDSFLNSSDNDKQEEIKEDLIRKNQLSNRKEKNSQIDQSNFNSNLADKESESYKSNVSSKSKQSESGSKSRMSVLSSAIRIGRADDTKSIFQNNNDTNSSVIEGKEPVISRRKPKNILLHKGNKDSPSIKNKINIAIDDTDPQEEERQKKKRFEEYKKIADEKYKKEFDFEFDVTSDENLDAPQIKTKNNEDNDFDEFELTGKSNESEKIQEEEDIIDSDDESGFMRQPPRFEFHLKPVDDDADQPVKSTIKSTNITNENTDIKVINKADAKQGENKRLIDNNHIQNIINKVDTDKNENDDAINSDEEEMKKLQSEIKKRILKHTGAIIFNKSHKRFGQPRDDSDSVLSKSDNDQHSMNQSSLNKNANKQFNEKSDKMNQILSHSFLKNSNKFNHDNINNHKDNEEDDSDDKYGYVSDDEEEIKGLPRPKYFDNLNNDFENLKKNKNTKQNEKPSKKDTLYSSPLPPDPSVSSDSNYQPVNERLTFYEKKKKPSKTTSSSKTKKKIEREKDSFESTVAEPSLLRHSDQSDEF